LAQNDKIIIIKSAKNMPLKLSLAEIA
jgi:hypothetical protein